MTLRPVTCRGFVGLLNPPETIVAVIPLPNDPDMLLVIGTRYRDGGATTFQLQTLQNQVVRKFRHSDLVRKSHFGNPANPTAAVITGDGRFIICGFSNGALTRHDVATGKLLNERMIEGAEGERWNNIHSLAVNASNTVLAVGLEEANLEFATLDLQPFATTNLGTVPGQGPNTASHLVAIADNTIAAMTDNKGICIVRPDATTGALQATWLEKSFSSSASYFDPMARSPDGRLLACISGPDSTTLRIFNIATCECVAVVVISKPNDEEGCAIVSVTFCTQDLLAIATIGQFDMTRTVQLVSVSLGTKINEMTFEQLGVVDGVWPLQMKARWNHTNPADAPIAWSRVASSREGGVQLLVMRVGTKAAFGQVCNMLQLYPLDVSPAKEDENEMGQKRSE